MKLIYCLLPWLSQPNLGQIKLSGAVLESSGWADSKNVPGFDNWPRFVGVIEQNKILNSLCHYCMSNIGSKFDLMPIFNHGKQKLTIKKIDYYVQLFWMISSLKD